MDENTRLYLSHFSPTSIIQTFTDASAKFKAHYNIPSVNPFYYLDPRTIQAYLLQPENFRNVLRVIVVVTVYLLFRTRLEGWLRGMSGAPEGREEGVVRRVEELKKREREGVGSSQSSEGGGNAGAGNGKKDVKKDR